MAHAFPPHLTECASRGSINGRVDLQFTAKKGQSITLYFRNYDASRGGTLFLRSR